VLVPVVVGASGVAACGDRDPGPASAPPAATAADAAARFPDVVGASAARDPDGTWSFTVTISSPYDSPDRYADGWRVLGPDGTVHGEHTLAHDHATEQPFTRTQRGVVVPDDVTEVTIEGRDLEHGYGGATLTIPLPDT
jgi:hypothetical protein